MDILEAAKQSQIACAKHGIEISQDEALSLASELVEVFGFKVITKLEKESK